MTPLGPTSGVTTSDATPGVQGSGADHLAYLASESAAIAAVLRSTPLGTPVSDCPGWTLGDLARHVGALHRWAAVLVSTGERSRLPAVDVTDEDLAAWFEDGGRDLGAVLAEVDPASPCWTLTGPGTAGFWRRRMALETAVHRVDAERDRGTAGPIADDLAEDGVAEVLEMMLPRQIELERLPSPGTGVMLVAQTSGRSWLLGPAPAAATVSGPAGALFLLLWRRTSRTDPALDCQGDLAALDALLALSLTP